MSSWWRDLVLVSAADEQELAARLDGEGYAILELDGSAAAEKASLLEAVDRDIQAPGGLKSSGSWDAFADCLWLAVMEHEAETVALVWRHADRMLEHGLADLLAAVTVLTRVSKQVTAAAEKDPDAGGPAAFRTFLLGAGENFPPIGATITPA